MRVKVCPKCGRQNLSSALKCLSCGEYLSVGTLKDTDRNQLLSEIMDNKAGILNKSFFGGVIAILIGIGTIILGYKVAIDDANDAKRIEDSGVLSQAVILNRYHYVDLSDHDKYSIKYGFQAQSPYDGEWKTYSKNQTVSWKLFNSIEGCEDILESNIPGCESIDSSSEGTTFFCDDDLSIDLAGCTEITTTIGTESVVLLDCTNVDIGVQRKLKGCEEIQVIYLFDDPDQSWILGTEPQNSSGGIVIMIFGVIFLSITLYQILKQSTFHVTI